MKRNRAENGFTYVELMASMAILSGLSLAALALMGAAHEGYGYSTARTSLEDRSRVALKEISRELAAAGIGSPDWQFTPTEIRYNRSQGYDYATGAQTWGELRRFRLDGDTVLFEEIDAGGDVVFSRPLLTPVTSFQITQDEPDLLTITVALVGVDTRGRPIPVNGSATVFLRN